MALLGGAFGATLGIMARRLCTGVVDRLRLCLKLLWLALPSPKLHSEWKGRKGVVQGAGSWSGRSWECRPAYRIGPQNLSKECGFRLMLRREPSSKPSVPLINMPWAHRILSISGLRARPVTCQPWARRQ